VRLLQQAELSNSFKEKLIPILSTLRQDRMAIVMNSTKEVSSSALISMMSQLESFTRAFTDYWVSMGFDAVISTAGILPAIPHKFSSELFPLNSHYMIYNILDYPAGVVPVKLVQ
jgi:protein tyrosine phosphatase